MRTQAANPRPAGPSSFVRHYIPTNAPTPAMHANSEKGATDHATRGGTEETHSPAPVARPGVGDATVRFLNERLAHDSTEDLHPSRLDSAESDLDDALARSALAQKNAKRDARDAA